MLRNFWRKYHSNPQFTHADIIAAITAIGFIIAVRLLGGLQFLELSAFDTFMRLRPKESPDERILVVGINEDDIRNIGQYPIPDGKIASLLQELQIHQPAAIGLDIYRDLAVPPGTDELTNTFKQTKNVIGVEKIVPDISGKTVNSPPTLPSEQLGFADAVSDKDGKQRRALLGASNTNDEWRLSFPLQLTRIYLENQGIKLDNVEGDEYGMKFGSVKLERFLSNSGGYIRADAKGSQILINFRSHPQPFNTVSLTDVLNKKIAPEKIRNKIVLIGITSPSAKDYVVSEAIKLKDDTKDSLIYGVVVQAHVTSQIISAVENGRTFLKVLPDFVEYLGIVIIGLTGIVLGRRIKSSIKLVLFISLISFFLLGTSYILLIFGWWIPIVPFLTAFLCNGLVISIFYKYDAAVKETLHGRQIVIDQVFETIHGGPLQSLSMILRNLDGEDNFHKPTLSMQLKHLNQELREVHQLLKKEISSNDDSFYLRIEQKLNLKQPIHEILHQVYTDVMERINPEFTTLKIKLVDFLQLDEQNLTVEQKRALCRFLEEGLTNAGKYAKGITILEVICKQEQGANLIRVSDNGCGIEDYNRESQGLGTKQAINLAKQLRGKFERSANSPKGTVYQLTWTAKKSGIWRF
ncbi:similar to adenylate cyclase (plasmid) [Calothrix sp. PCC 7716]|nr:similar to adenylate cyclase [Calothrix sp. PCC 7716]